MFLEKAEGNRAITEMKRQTNGEWLWITIESERESEKKRRQRLKKAKESHELVKKENKKKLDGNNVTKYLTTRITFKFIYIRLEINKTATLLSYPETLHYPRQRDGTLGNVLEKNQAFPPRTPRH